MHLTVSPNLMQCMPYGFPKNHRAMQNHAIKSIGFMGMMGLGIEPSETSSVTDLKR